MIQSSEDSIGNWGGQEKLAYDNFNQIQLALIEALPDNTCDESIHELFKDAWDHWGSNEKLLKITVEEIKEYIQLVV